MDTYQAVFEKIYREICRSICRKFEVANRLGKRDDPYPNGKIDGLFEALYAAAVYIHVAPETLEELQAMEGI